MKADQLAVVQGWPHTVLTLRRWRTAPWAVLGEWALGSLLVAVALLGATWLVASSAVPDQTLHVYPGVNEPASPADFEHILGRNFTVLALHALACVAGFMAGWVRPGERRSRTQRHAGPLAIVFVTAATLFSLLTQANALGHIGADLSRQLGVAPSALMLAILPHALPELFAVFLPLAAWSIASRRGAWHELLAATLVTTAIAIPLIVVAAYIETYVTPGILVGLNG
ncbi:MAG TPA: stage II sporulation protein M [Ktedonobacterales bacterium]|nr:stage II sporulation protein M [Ktedonobacterales bacterium]